MDGRDPSRGDVLHRGFERALVHRVSRRGHHVFHELHGVVFQNARGLPVPVALDRAAGNVRGVRGDTRGLEGQGIREGHVTVEPADPDRVLGRHGVDHAAVRQLAAPKLMVPISPRDPRSGRHCFRELSDALGKELGRVGIPKLNGREIEAPAQEVDVRVDEPRHDELARGVDDGRVTDERAYLGARADREEAPVGGCEKRLGLGVVGVSRPDRRVQDRERGLGGIISGRGATTRQSDEAEAQPERASQRRPCHGSIVWISILSTRQKPVMETPLPRYPVSSFSYTSALTKSNVFRRVLIT